MLLRDPVPFNIRIVGATNDAGRRGQLESMSLGQPFTYSLLSNGREALPSHGSVQMSGVILGDTDEVAKL